MRQQTLWQSVCKPGVEILGGQVCEGGLVAAENLTAVMDCPDSGRDHDNLATLRDAESRVFISCTKSFTFLK